MGRRRWKMLSNAKATETLRVIDSLSNESKGQNGVPTVDPIIRNPVEIYQDGKWMVVDRSFKDFPHPVKLKISPDWALQVLMERNSNNRKVREDRVEKYIRDILNNNWEVINNGIGFYEDGSLADGQHRLWAVVESQQTVEVIVVFGMKKSAVSKIDEGAARSTKDVATMMGLEASNSSLSVTNYILEYRNTRRTTPRSEQIAFYERHREAVDFIISRLKRKGIAKAPVHAALMRAYYNIDRDKLVRFIEVLETGMPKDASEQAAITLREFLLKNNNNSGPFRAETYKKTEAAIVNFIDGKPIERLYGMKDEQFFLPEEKLEAPVAPASSAA